MKIITSNNKLTHSSSIRRNNEFFPKRAVLMAGMLLNTFYSGAAYSINAAPDFVSSSVNAIVSIPVLQNDTLTNGASAASDPNTFVCLDPRKFSSICSASETFFVATSPANGSLTLSGKTVIYTPNQNFVGTDSFTYTLYHSIAGSQSESASASVTISVQGSSQPPTEEPTQPPTEEPTQPPTEEPTQPPTEEPTQPPTEEPTQPPTEEPTQPPTEEPTQPPTEEPTEPPAEEPTEPPAEEPAEEPVEEPVAELTEEQKLANAVTSLCSSASNSESPSTELADSCAALNNLPADEQTAALVTLAADQVTAGYSSTINLSRNQSANIYSRLTQLKHNTSGLSLQGLTIRNYGDMLNGEWLQAAYTTLAEDGMNPSQETGGGAGDVSSNTYTPFGYFINGSITLGEKDSSATERGYDLDSDNYTLGMDYRFSDQLVVGAAYGYSSSSVDFSSTGDDMDNKVNNLFLYGSFYDNNFFFSSTLGYAFGELDTSRRIVIPNTLDTQAKGTTDTSQLILQLNGSYDMNRGALSFGPYAKLDIIDGKIDSYSETNGGGFEVDFDEQDISSQLLTLGGQAQYALSYSWGVLLPRARFELKKEFNDSQDAINARFVFDTTNTQFSITADEIDNLWYIFGTGLTAVFPHGISAYVDFETTTGLNRLDLYTYSFGGRWELLF